MIPAMSCVSISKSASWTTSAYHGDAYVLLLSHILDEVIGLVPGSKVQSIKDGNGTGRCDGGGGPGASSRPVWV